MTTRTLIFVIFLIWSPPLFALECVNDDFEGVSFTRCDVLAGEDDLRLFLRDQSGTMYGHFYALNAELNERGLELAFAMNAGMFRPDFTPAGLYVEDGITQKPLVTRAGPGNFGLLPNGIFCLNEAGFHVYETLSFAKRGQTCRYASQSGPMLVIDGALHPRFLKGSTSKFIRNGVGTSKDGTSASFVISNKPVTFHHFARFFRDHLGLSSALYFDGNVSRLYAPELNRLGLGRRMGPIVGVVKKAR